MNPSQYISVLNLVNLMFSAVLTRSKEEEFTNIDEQTGMISSKTLTVSLSVLVRVL